MRYTKGDTIIKNGGQVRHMPHENNRVTTQHFIPPTIISGLIHYAEQNQLEYLTWFDDLDISLDQLRKGDGFLDFQTISKIIQHAIEQCPLSNLGLRVGSDKALISIGILGFTMQSCKNIEEALRLGLKFHPISGSALDLHVHLDHNILELSLTERFSNKALLAFFCEEALASILTFLKSMIGDHDDLLSLELSYEEPQNIEMYCNFFKCPISFNSSKNCLRFNANILRRTLNTHSQANYSASMQVCEQTYLAYQKINQPQYYQKIYYLIEQHLPDRLNMEQVAHFFSMSERQLRRILLVEGLNFQNIRQEVLETKAKQLIQEDHSITDISSLLGFSELREFRRAFKKWTGEAPLSYKKNKLSSSVF